MEEENLNSNTGIVCRETLEGWAKSEKFELLQALEEYGSTDIDQIQNFLSTKSKKQIQEAIEYYRAKALENPEVVSKRERRIVNTCTAPLAKWASSLTDTKSFEELKTHTATALQLIAEFEDKSPLICTDKFDFKNVYHILANALEGKILSDDFTSKALIEKCIIDTAYSSKSFIKSSVLKHIIEGVNLSVNNVHVTPKVNLSHELANIRYLIKQKEYNPLNISEDDVKFQK